MRNYAYFIGSCANVNLHCLPSSSCYGIFDALIRLAEILEVYVSELLGTKIENENVASDVAEQLSRINEQLAIKNRRSRRIWKIVAIILAVIVLVNIFIAVFFSVPDLNSNTQNNPLAISDETISIDE